MNFYLKRIIMTVPTLLGISMITFVLLQALPGDPVQGLAGDRADPAVLERIRRDMGTDRPIALQYVGYMKLLMQGELGRSHYTNRSVLGDIAQKLPNTILLAATAMLFSTCFGILLGIFMAVQQGTIWDRLALMLSTAGISLPVFWLGLLLIYLFSFKLQLLPPAGMGSGYQQPCLSGSAGCHPGPEFSGGPGAHNAYQHAGSTLAALHNDRTRKRAERPCRRVQTRF